MTKADFSKNGNCFQLKQWVYTVEITKNPDEKQITLL